MCLMYHHCSFSIIIKKYSCTLHVYDYATQIALYSIRKRKPQNTAVAPTFLKDCGVLEA